jgi:hypothetical protein
VLKENGALQVVAGATIEGFTSFPMAVQRKEDKR